MARRNNAQTIAQGAGWTDVFQADDAGGSDGSGMRDVLISVAASSANPAEYRIEGIDPTGEQGTLAAGESVRIATSRGKAGQILRIQMRGVGGPATGGVEELTFT